MVKWAENDYFMCSSGISTSGRTTRNDVTGKFSAANRASGSKKLAELDFGPHARFAVR